MKPTITIGMCTGGSVRAETTNSLLSAVINMAQDGLPVNVLFQIGGYVDVNRNKLVETAQAQGSDYLMFIDADMIFPDDGIKTLLSRKKDIVGANYNARLAPTAKILSGPTTKMKIDGKVVSMVSEDFPTKLFKCYAIPTGFMLIKMSVFKKLEPPYFEAHQDGNGQHHTEDVDFCRKAGEAGIEVWCDPTIKMGHIGQYVY